MRRDWRKILRNPVVSLVGGLALGGLGIGLLIAILVLVIQPAATPEQAGLVQYKAGRFTLWYQKDSSARAGRERLAARLDDEMQGLSRRLGVGEDKLPGTIDVFVHDDVQAMQRGIAVRKSPEARTVYEAPLDLLDGENPVSRLAELVLTFGWGRCGSQILWDGMRLYAADPGRNYHAVTAALPERLFLTLPQLVRLEDWGRFPPTLYERYDSPYSPATVGSLVDLRDLLNLSAGQATGLATLECASFVQYLVEQRGIDGVRRLWGEPNTQRVIEAIGTGAAALGRAWRTEAIAAGAPAPDYPRLRAQYLLESGDSDAAYAITSSWSLEGLSQDELLVAAHCALCVGAFKEVSRLAMQAQGDLRTQLGAVVMLSVGWEARTDDRVRVIAPAGSAEGVLSVVSAALSAMASRLDLDATLLPARLTVFVYPDEAAREKGQTLADFPPTQSAILHILSTDDPVAALGQVLPAYVWKKDTYSRLLRDGVATALAQDAGVLEDKGCALKAAGKWVPLAQADYGTADAETIAIEAGLMIDYLLERFGPATLARLWTSTSPLDRYISLDGALEEECGITRNDINELLARSFLPCD